MVDQRRSEVTFSRGPLRLRAVVEGPDDGEPVVLLHGFPQRVSSWDAVAPLLHEAGFRTIALDQRGYCATARPSRRRDYRLSELVGDVVALLDAVSPAGDSSGRPDREPDGGPGGTSSAHIVGHDWGAMVAWALASAHPERVRTLTAVSVPHPAAFVRSMVTSDQLRRSWYIGFFQLPFLPEKLLTSGGSRIDRVLGGMGMSHAMIERFHRDMVDDGAVPGGVGWYRAVPFASPKASTRRVRVPTTFVWSDDDPALGRGGAEQTGRFVDADYRFVEMSGVSHWIPEERPAELADAIVARARG